MSDLYRFDSNEGVWYIETPDGPTRLGGGFVDRLSAEEEAAWAPSSKILIDKAVSTRAYSLLPAAHSNRDRLSQPPRRQGGRGTCTSFAFVSALEARLAALGWREILSPQYASWVFTALEDPPRNWCEDYIRLCDAVRCLLVHGICREALCPYQRTTGEWCEKEGPLPEAHADARFRVAEASVIPKWSGRDEPHGTLSDIDTLKRLIWHGYDIVISVHSQFGKVLVGDRVHHPDYIEGKPREPPCGFPTHAMLVVGYGRDGDYDYFECRDSAGLGKDYAHQGHLRLSREFVEAYATYGVVVLEVAVDAR